MNLNWFKSDRPYLTGTFLFAGIMILSILFESHVLNNTSLFLLSGSLFFIFLGFWGMVGRYIIEEQRGGEKITREIEKGCTKSTMPIFSMLCFYALTPIFAVAFLISLFIF